MQKIEFIFINDYNLIEQQQDKLKNNFNLINHYLINHKQINKYCNLDLKKISDEIIKFLDTILIFPNFLNSAFYIITPNQCQIISNEFNFNMLNNCTGSITTEKFNKLSYKKKMAEFIDIIFSEIIYNSVHSFLNRNNTKDIDNA